MRFDVNGHAVFGSTWFGGKGAKERMKQQALTTGARWELQMTEPDSGNRG